MSEAVAAGAAAPAKKGKTKLLIVAGLATVLLVGGGGAAFTMMKKAPADEEAADEEAADEADDKAGKKKKKKRASGAAPVFVTLETFTVNLADADNERFAQIGIVLEVTEKKVDDVLKANMPAVRNAILLLLSSKTSKQILTLEGKEQLSTQVAAAVTERIGKGTIDTVHFSQFIVQ